MAEKRISEHEDILAKPSKTEKQRGKKKNTEKEITESSRTVGQLQNV